jgi:hypothetical protein
MLDNITRREFLKIASVFSFTGSTLLLNSNSLKASQEIGERVRDDANLPGGTKLMWEQTLKSINLTYKVFKVSGKPGRIEVHNPVSVYNHREIYFDIDGDNYLDSHWTVTEAGVLFNYYTSIDGNQYGSRDYEQDYAKICELIEQSGGPKLK